VLDALLQLSTVPIQVKKDPERLRPADVHLMLGDASEFHRHTGWKAEIDFHTTLGNVSTMRKLSNFLPLTPILSHNA
jgi:GDP-4-dehydro-6-deoxy-D-mannose reductase